MTRAKFCISQPDGLTSGSVTLRRTEAKQGDRNREHIETDHLLPNLKRHTIVGGAIMISAQAAKFVLNLGSTVILARLLTPRDFGLVAMVTAVTGFWRYFGMQVLQRPRCNENTSRMRRYPTCFG